MITITYISKDRPAHLNNSLHSLFKQTSLPSHIVVTDCSDNKKPIEDVIENIKKETSIPITYVWKNKNELSRSQGRSLGRQYAETPLVVSTEGDILYPPNLIEECLKAFGNPPGKCYVQPYWTHQREDGSIPDKPTHYKGGFFQVYRTEDFDAIGGYNPFFKNWGWEDNDFENRLMAYGCKHIVVPSMVVHMWHVSVANNETNFQNQKIAENSYWDSVEKRWIMRQV